ncbi:hypothetical protein M3Y99_01260200 [Aphelenchoides fujianensis]|nr:hypothetical protein M3Y99_01260200 [Aphelenchoides fujianensis]
MRRATSAERTPKPAAAPPARRRQTAPPRRSAPAPAALLAQLPPALPAGLLRDAAQNAQFAQSLLVMRRWANGVCRAGVEGLRREFRGLRVPPGPHAAMDRNLRKCRYKDVFCNDRSRVVLRMPPGESDFIHNQFICAQGPLPHTCRDFWTMVWQERVAHVFMLCRVEELGRPKCAQYWPAARGESACFGALLVRNDGVQRSRCGNIVTTALGVAVGAETRRIFHRQWATWPDRFIPRHVEPAMRLLDVSRACSANPTVVHCSAGSSLVGSFVHSSSFAAGIGRTGTLVAMEFLLRALHLGTEPNAPAVVRHIRAQRAQAVQTEDQYVYVHYAVLQRVRQFGALLDAESRAFFAEYEKFMQAIGSEPPVPLPAYEPRPRAPPQRPPAASKTPPKQTASSSGKRRSVERSEETPTAEQPTPAAPPADEPPSARTAQPGTFEPTTYFDGRALPAAAVRQQQHGETSRVLDARQVESLTRQVQDDGPLRLRLRLDWKESKRQQSTDSDETPASPNLAQLAERAPFAMSKKRAPQPPSAPTSSSRSPTFDDEEKPGEERYCYNKKKYVGTAEFTVERSDKK